MSEREVVRATSIVVRRFNLGDLAIIIAAAALWFAAVRSAWSTAVVDEGWTFYTPTSSVTSNLGLLMSGYHVVEDGWLAATIGLVAMRLRQPRPRWGRLMRQPGWNACIAAGTAGLAGEAIGLSRALGDQLVRSIQPGNFNMPSPAAIGLPTCLGGVAVLVSWSILALGKRWCSEPTWLDRAGRITGGGWLVLVPTYLVLETVSRFV